MEKDSILHMRVAEETKAKIDILRKNEPDLPSRSEMVRRLVDRAENAIESNKLRGAPMPKHSETCAP